jgi:hypothetical protein
MPRRRRALPPMLAMALAGWLASAALLYAGNIRGRILRAGPRGDYPAGGIAVRVWRQGAGWSGAVYSGPDGMYYLYRIPPGQYSLCVWPTPKSRPFTYAIQVSNQPWTDLAPIRLR